MLSDSVKYHDNDGGKNSSQNSSEICDFGALTQLYSNFSVESAELRDRYVQFMLYINRLN